MTRRRRPVTVNASGNLAGAVLAVVVIAIGFLIAFWKALLITAAILAVPFGIWWLLDREKRKTAEQEAPQRGESTPPPFDPVEETLRAEDLGLPDSAEYWRGHYQPHHHEEEAQRRSDREVARNREIALADSRRRADEAKRRFYERRAQEVEQAVRKDS